ncbi:hypothetical protein ENUP19_0044G0032 [Entamoeba nuttalli]
MIGFELREVHHTLLCKMVSITTCIALIISLYIFFFQFTFALDKDLINNTTLSLHENNIQHPEGTCQSDPYKHYTPFSLTLETENESYSFWCSPYIHYQVFVLCFGWLLNSGFIAFCYMYTIVFHYNTNKQLFISSIYCGFLGACGIYDIVNWTRTQKFCTEIIPNITYGQPLKSFTCQSTSYLVFAISELVCSIMIILNYIVLSYFYNKYSKQNVFSFTSTVVINDEAPIGSPIINDKQ